MLITIRRPWLLRLFGWRYDVDGKPRAEWPSYVTASAGLWWFWLRRGAQPMRLHEEALRHHKIEL